MKDNGYQEIEHTADVAIRAWGEDRFNLLEVSASGMYDLMDLTYNPSLPVTVNFRLDERNLENLLIDFLNELLYLAEEKGQYFNCFSFTEGDDQLEVSAEGFQILSVNRQIKAATFHNLEVTKGQSGLEVTITFDV